MKLSNRIAAFTALGSLIRSFSEEEIKGLARRAAAKNNWFTEENVRLALEGISTFLEEEKLKEWLAPYELPEENPVVKKIGIVMAGNIPLVGFHDFLSVLISGHELHAKLSSQDPILIPFLAQELFQIEPQFRKYLFFEERLNNMDALIATGSDNSSRYFEYYFRNIPHIIRRNRSSCAVLDGNENREELEQLGEDITRYFGLGCRNVSKLFVPEGYDFSPLFESLEKYGFLRNHHKFVNNYDYNKSIYLVNGTPHLDTGFLLFKEDEGMVSPISVVFYETYPDLKSLQDRLKEQEEKTQCVVGHKPLGEVPFGQAQRPEVWEYADRVDTIAFLKNL